MIRHFWLIPALIALPQLAAAQTTSQRYAEACRVLIGPLPAILLRRRRPGSSDGGRRSGQGSEAADGMRPPGAAGQWPGL